MRVDGQRRRPDARPLSGRYASVFGTGLFCGVRRRCLREQRLSLPVAFPDLFERLRRGLGRFRQRGEGGGAYTNRPCHRRRGIGGGRLHLGLRPGPHWENSRAHWRAR